MPTFQSPNEPSPSPPKSDDPVTGVIRFELRPVEVHPYFESEEHPTRPSTPVALGPYRSSVLPTSHPSTLLPSKTPPAQSEELQAFLRAMLRRLPKPVPIVDPWPRALLRFLGLM